MRLNDTIIAETDHEIGLEPAQISALTFPDAATPAPVGRFRLEPGLEKEIRDYQWELALLGLSGQNYIVCAPTGSGKTRVAGLVISEHLIRMKGRGKVLFVVNKVPLVLQQRLALQRMIHGAKLQEVCGEMAPHKKSMLSPQGRVRNHPSESKGRTRASSSEGGATDHPSESQGRAHARSSEGDATDHPGNSVEEGSKSQGEAMCGAMDRPSDSQEGATNCPRDSHPSSSEEEDIDGVQFSLDNDIIVCTAGCLFNELDSGRMSLSAISLLVIDECHNTRKRSNYAQIMEMYVRAKLAGEETLPQVMGLTATPGAGDSARPTLATVLEHLTTICAAMDAMGGIQIVRKNIPELRLHQTSAVSSTAILEGRNDDKPFIALIVGIITQLERLYKMKPPSESKWSQNYTVWVSGELTKSQSKDNRDWSSVLQTLKGLSSTLKIYSNLCYEDAMEELGKLAYPSDLKATPMEMNLSKVIGCLRVKLRSLDKVDNPLLLQLEDILHDKFQSTPESKAVIFVETKIEATSIDRWIKTRARLSSIHSDVLTGQTRDTGKTMTKAEQSASLSGFRGTDCNLLVSTSVLEEGIDVPACNLVIRYQKVTSEIAQVQSRGRARAKNSHSITIVSSKSGKQFQEVRNEEKVALVEEALRMLPVGENLRMKIEAKQANLLKQGDQRKKVESHRYLYNPAEVDIHCRGCSAFLCNALHIRTIPSTLHYVVVDDGFLSNVNVKVHHKPSHVPWGLSRSHKLYCKACEVRGLGVLGKWWSRQVQYPVLKCIDIKFKIKGKNFQCRKWKDVPFQVSPLD